jgi:hypothetical protein
MTHIGDPFRPRAGGDDRDKGGPGREVLPKPTSPSGRCATGASLSTEGAERGR